MTVDYPSTVADRARIMWCMRLSSAVRTALACAIVGAATLYGPKFIVNEIRFAAFSYLTAVLIVSDASLGDTLRGCWHAFCATAQVVPLGVLVRWIIAPTDGVPVSVMAVVVAVVTFLVALPECTHLTAKRIAFGQIVLVCTDVVVSGGTSVGVMHPVYVAASTALGALASVLALLVLYPELACYKVRIGFSIATMASKGRLEFAFKCSLSLSMAVLFGLIFDKENGCWAGLTIAISFVTGRQAVFTIANTRAQGTAIGSVYGVIISFLFHCEELKLLALLPWIIFTSFLRHSKMYGQTGGVSAAIGALLILGRKNYGAPNEFAIARLAEVFIGLSAFIMVELLLQPIRAATLAKNHLCQTMSALQDCIKETGICSVDKNKIVSKFIELRDKQRNSHSLVGELKRYVADAELEPDFWYLPFRTSSYQKLVESLSNIADMLYFITYNFEVLSELSEPSTECKELHEHMNSELELFKETLSSSRVYLETANSTESLADSRDRMDETFMDLEEGKLQNPNELNVITSEHKEAERTTEESGDNKKYRERMMQCLGATGFCISSLMKEIDDTKICIKEINRWENHSRK